MTRACIFCGRRPPEVKMSREHALGDWLAAELPDAARPAQVVQIREHDGRTDARGLNPIPFGYISKEVCEPCNNGWLSRIEDDASALLKPGIHGSRVRLRHRDQVGVGAWAYKSAAILNLSLGSNGAAVTRAQAPRFLSTERPPPSSHVWVCWLAEGDRFSGQVATWSAKLTAAGVDPEDGVRNLFFVAYGTGALVWFVMATTVPELVGRLPLSGDSPHTSVVWPAALEARTVPPANGRRLTLEKCVQIVQDFSESLGEDRLLPDSIGGLEG